MIIEGKLMALAIVGSWAVGLVSAQPTPSSSFALWGIVIAGGTLVVSVVSNLVIGRGLARKQGEAEGRMDERVKDLEKTIEKTEKEVEARLDGDKVKLMFENITLRLGHLGEAFDKRLTEMNVSYLKRLDLIEYDVRRLREWRHDQVGEAHRKTMTEDDPELRGRL